MRNNNKLAMVQLHDICDYKTTNVFFRATLSPLRNQLDSKRPFVTKYLIYQVKKCPRCHDVFEN